VSSCTKKGANRKGSTFWAEVTTLANVLITEDGKLPEREVLSVKNRFKRMIQPAVLAFKPYHKQAMKEHNSGWNAEMYMQLATELWERDEGKPYLYPGCSTILKSLAKYDWEAVPVDPEEEGTNLTGGPMGGTFLRPPGNKKSKAADRAKRKGKGKGSTDSVMTTEATTASAVAESREHGLKIMSQLEEIKLQQAMYFRFNMLTRQGKHVEANAIMKQMDDMNNPPAAVSARAVARIPATVAQLETVFETDSDDEGEDEESSSEEVAARLKKDDDEDDSSHSSQDDSGGDPRPRRKINVTEV
jgi:hypothetical protein